jgi:trigger factor
LSVERLPESLVRLDITADEDEFAKAMDRAYRRVGGRISVPGFRPGKAPRAMIERLYGRGVFLEEAGKELMNDLYRRALEQEELAPVGEPEVEIVEAEPLSFQVTIPIYPTVDPAAYLDVRVEPKDAAVASSEVDEAIERLRKEHSPWVDPAEDGLSVGADLVLTPRSRLPREGDQVTIDYTVRQGDQAEAETEEDAVFVLGESGLLDQLEAAIKGLRIGERTAFEVSFAADDESVDEDLRGNTLSYDVTLKGLKERELLPLDDELARTVGDFDTLDELRRDIESELHRRRTAETRAEVVSAIIKATADQAIVEVPAAMVDVALDEEVRGFASRMAARGIPLESYLRLTNQTDEEMREGLRAGVAERVRNTLVLREVAKREGITVEDEAVESDIDRLAAGSVAGADLDPARRRQLFEGDYVREMIHDRLFNERLTSRLVEIATEGRGAVLNAWVAPEPATAEEAAATADESAPIDEALTLGTMPGQPGDLSEAKVAEVAADTGEETDETPPPTGESGPLATPTI